MIVTPCPRAVGRRIKIMNKPSIILTKRNAFSNC